ncbi:MAG: leucine-rich repeat domain-containing protein [Clostridia bacterium]|nr:leucine-rich repeat domain-containing protein [Clostridia bacterium]
MKKTLVILLVFLMLLPCATSCGENAKLEYELLDDGTYGVKAADFFVITVDELVIPAEYNGKPVTKILKEGFEGSRFRKVIIPDTVTTIGTKAFYNCHNLASVTIPSNVAAVHAEAFYNCSALVEVQNLSAIEMYVEQYEDGSVVWVIDENGNKKKSQSFRNLLRIYGANEESLVATTEDGWTLYDGQVALDYNGNEKNIKVPEGVVSILSSVERADNTETITIPDTVQYIAKSAFYAKNLHTVIFEGTLEEWEELDVKIIYTVVCSDGTIEGTYR